MFFIHRCRKSCSSALLFGFCINDDYCGAIAKQIDGVHHSFCAQFDQLHTYIHIVHFVSVASDRHRSPSLPLVKHNRVGTLLFILTVRKRDLKTDNKIQLPLWEHWWKKAGSRLWMSIFVKLSIPSCSEICHFLNHFSPHGIFKSILHTHPNNSFNIKVQTYY